MASSDSTADEDSSIKAPRSQFHYWSLFRAFVELRRYPHRHGVVRQFLAEVDELAFSRTHELNTALIFFKPGQIKLFLSRGSIRQFGRLAFPALCTLRNWAKLSASGHTASYAIRIPYHSGCFPLAGLRFSAYEVTVLAPQGFQSLYDIVDCYVFSTCSTAESTSVSTSPNTVSIFTPTGQSRLGGCRCNEKTPPYSSALYIQEGGFCRIVCQPRTSE